MSYDPTENATFVRTWNVVNGALHNEERFETVITDNTVKDNELGMVSHAFMQKITSKLFDFFS